MNLVYINSKFVVKTYFKSKSSDSEEIRLPFFSNIKERILRSYLVKKFTSITYCIYIVSGRSTFIIGLKLMNN